MKYLLLSLIYLLVPAILFSKDMLHDHKLCFIENIGQVRDQHNKPRTDIDAQLNSNGLSVSVGKGALHYQFYTSLAGSGQGKIATYRMDVELLGAHLNAAPKLLDKQSYYERYYTSHFGEQGGLAHSYGKVLYKNVYPGIDWLLYIKDNKLEHEFIVHKGANPDVIKIRYSGSSSLAINNDGSLTATTHMGSITEAAPLSYTVDGKKVVSTYRLEGNVLSFDIADYKGALVIDPSVVWGTYYYGSTSTVGAHNVVCAAPNDIYMSGASGNAEGLATVGAFQDTLYGSTDAFLVKFDSSGNRIWCTYYGGNSIDGGYGMACDSLGNIYLCGKTLSTDAIATSGAFQQVYGGGGDVFLAKFTPAGVRIWATYYGGTGSDAVTNGVSVRGASVCITGQTSSPGSIASGNGFQTQYAGNIDNFLVKFDSSGNRIWGTYYGGTGGELYSSSYIDRQGYIYMCGGTYSAADIASTGSHQPTKEADADGYLVKFDSGGQRIWGTYYGGEGSEELRGVVTDSSGNVYICGITGAPASTFNIATSGGLQQAPAGGADIFLAKFDPLGERIWGTYYGGAGIEALSYSGGMAIDAFGDIYFGGAADTQGIAAIAPSVLQPLNGGAGDAFITKMDSTGAQIWASYYGGDAGDMLYSISTDGIGNVYFCGVTYSYNGIATPGAFIDSFSGGGSPGYLVRVRDTLYPVSILSLEANNALHIYPNPTNGTFNIHGMLTTSGHYVFMNITNIIGQTVYSTLFQAQQKEFSKQIDLPRSLPSGVYIVNVISGNTAVTRRLIKN